MVPIDVDLSTFRRDLYDKLTRYEQDALMAYLWAASATDEGGHVPWPGEDAAMSPEAFRPVELAAMCHWWGFTSAAQVKAIMALPGIRPPSQAKLDAVIQRGKQQFWLNW